MKRYVFRISLFLIFSVVMIPRPLEAKQISLLVMASDSPTIDAAIRSLKVQPGIKVTFFTYEDLLNQPESAFFIRHSNAIVVDVMDRRLSRYIQGHVNPHKIPVYAVRGSRNDALLKQQGFRFNKEVQTYYRNMTVRNIRNMIGYIIHTDINHSQSYHSPVVLPSCGIYHPDAPKIFISYNAYLKWYRGCKGFHKGNPWVGVMIYKSFLGKGKTSAINTLTRMLEANGFNVMVAYGRAEKALKFFLPVGGKRRVQIILSFSMKFHASLNARVHRYLREIDVPVINAISLYSRTIEAWRKDPKGISPVDVVWCMATPEMSGQIEPTPLMGKVKLKDKVTGKIIYEKRVIRDDLVFLMARLKKWIALQEKPDRQKRVAILFYNHSQGKQNIGASYLNVFKSIQVILKHMRKAGYRISSKRHLTAKMIRGLILKYARNIGSWAPGELDKLTAHKEVVEIPIATYKKWFRRLPKAFRQAVIKQWGPIDQSKIMIHDGKFVVPCVLLGHVVLLPEPARGWGDDPMKLYHSPTLYPHHQYIAVYLWLKYGFKADAMIHLGTHATHEWLPGKQAGLTTSDPPEVLMTDIPNIYPYIVDDVGEGIQAKRRGRGVMIDHLIPPLKPSGLYEEYSRLYDLIESFNRLKRMGSPVAKEKLSTIEQMTKSLGLEKDLGLSTFTADDMEKLEHYLLKLKGTQMPYGLHTFGLSPTGDALRSTAEFIVKQNRHVKLRDVEKALEASGPREIKSLMRALNGRFIPPGEGNDPIRNPGAIPTGSDFYGFDPQKIPSRAAWKLGKEAAKKIIAEALKKDGTYPKKVAVILWATETIRNEGVNECTILYLIGVRPVWDKSGRVIGTKIIPARLLKRPRMDVLVNPSGLYRDLFPNMILFLDRAIRKAMVQSDIENFIREDAVKLRRSLEASGVSKKEANILSKIRIFSEKPGAYGTGVAETAKLSGVWKTDNDMADVYKTHVGFAYGEGLWGKPARKLFQDNLSNVDTIVQSMSSAVYGTMDNDDVFQYVGGMSLAVKKARGKAPRTVFSMTKSSRNLELQDAAETIGLELRARYLNPKWIKGMEKEGYAGARAMSYFFDNMWGWQVTIPKIIGGAKWTQAYDVYIKDTYGLHIKKFLDQVSPWAYQSITARMLEAVRKGYWKANGDIVKNLALKYAVNVVKRGVACCDHTCNNPLLNQMVVGIISLPGVATPKLVEEFKLAIERMAKKSLAKQVQSRLKLQKRLTAGFRKTSFKPSPKATPGKAKKTVPLSKGKSLQRVKGYKMEEIKSKDKTTEVSSAGVQWTLSIFLLLIVGLFIYGVQRGTRRD